MIFIYVYAFDMLRFNSVGALTTLVVVTVNLSHQYRSVLYILVLVVCLGLSRSDVARAVDVLIGSL